MMSLLAFLKEIGIIGFIDMALMSFLIYSVLVLFKKKRATFILSGILLSALLYLIAYQLNLVLITTVLQAFFAVILIAMIVIFKEELRDFFEEIAVWSTRYHFKKKKIPRLSRPEIEILVRTLNDLAREKIGALIVIKGKQSIQRHLEGGILLDGKLSEALLKSLFDPHSIGHDGAVLIESGRVAQLGCHLPLSNNFSQLTRKGTRHAAALGLSEVCDALCLVVSEERGKISVAYEGKLQEIQETKSLEELLKNYFERVNPTKKPKFYQDFFSKNYREKVIAAATAGLLWFFFVHESSLVYKSFEIPVDYPELEDNLVVERIDPSTVELTFSGPRNAFHLVSKKDMVLTLRLAEANSGKNRIHLSEANLTFPKNISLENIQPKSVDVEISREELNKK